MRQRGFTLIELMIVIAIIAVIAAVMAPNLIAARVQANETSAIATMRVITSCQNQFRTAAKADTDGDGTGEYGTFRELAGSIPVRVLPDGTTGSLTLRPPMLSGFFQRLTSSSEAAVAHSGYLFKVYLAGPGGIAVTETNVGTTDALDGTIDPDLSEMHWCVYGWPSRHGVSGLRTFFANQTGEILQTDTTAYTGSGVFDATNAGRAFRAGGALTSVTGEPAVGVVGRDGLVWKQVN